MDDDVRLAVTLHHAEGRDPQPVVVEALPYRKDDATLAYRSEYRRLAVEGRYHVARIDVRGTGSSEGIARDEYTEREQRDLETAIAWLATQPWSTGAVGMYGTSYSGFNSLQLAARRPPALRAVCAIYATDDRFTDDVHYSGGALRAIDLIDYCHYMTAFNALPPVPAVYGDGWVEAWRTRIERTEPWILTWLDEQVDSPYWRNGSLRESASGAGRDHGYEQIECATMIVAGWADGYRNNSFRTFERLQCPKALLFGPWSHMSTASSLPGPHVDLVPEMIRWWDRWLRDDGNGIDTDPPIRVFARHPTPPEPDLAMQAGAWRYEPTWPPDRLVERELRPSEHGTATVVPRGGVGAQAWISCAGALPWGQPLDLRVDDAFSCCLDWSVDEAIEVLGYPRLFTRVRCGAPVAQLSAKLESVFPDGTSALVSRGLLNLAHRTSMSDPTPLAAGEWHDIVVDLEVGSWTFAPGHRIRLALAGGDWPNTWMAPSAAPIEVDLDATRLVIPVLIGPGPIAGPPEFAHPPEAEPPQAGPPQAGPPEAAPGPSEVDHGEQVPSPEWRIVHDVLAREVRAETRYGSTAAIDFDGTYVDDYRGEVMTSTIDPAGGTATADTTIAITWPEGAVTARARLRFASSATHYDIEIDLDTTLDGEPFVHRTWQRRIPRHLQ